MSHNTGLNPLLEKELDELYKKVANGEEKGEKAGSNRRIAAYVLKGIAAGGSLLIATGLISEWDQGVGIAVLLAVFVDTITSNHKRMISEVEAGYAYRALRGKVKGEFNRVASSLIEKAKEGDSTAQEALNELMNTAHISLTEGIEKIENMRQSTNVEALKSLSLDQERSSK